MKHLTKYMWLNMKACISPARINELLNYFGSIEEIYSAKPHHYEECNFLSDLMRNALADKSMSQVEAELRLAEKENISIISCQDPYYPELLSEIQDPPIILYAKGNTDILKNPLTFSIVGTRNPSMYGIGSAMEISEQLAGCGITIVSGLALGIDTAAHTGALRAGTTIGVTGCGLLVNYPSGNESLRKRMTEEGLIISEYPLKTPPHSSNFPQRNRIISGLSLGTAVIEAGDKSGSLITAACAMEQGRDVFALPGNVTNKNARGTNRLIKDGATLLSSAGDILSEYIMRYPSLFSAKPHEYSSQASFEATGSHLSGDIDQTLADSACSAEDKSVLELISNNKMHINDLVRETGIDISRMNSVLTVLMIKGMVIELPGNFYIKK